MDRMTVSFVIMAGFALTGCATHWTYTNPGPPGEFNPAGHFGNKSTAELGHKDGLDGNAASYAEHEMKCASFGFYGQVICNVEFTIVFTKKDGERVAFQVRKPDGTVLKTVYLQDDTVGNVSRNFVVGVPCAEKVVVRTWVERGSSDAVQSHALVTVVRATCETKDRTNEPDPRPGSNQPTLYDQNGQPLPRP